MNRTVEVVEVGPRDGLQSEPDILPVAVKLELIARLVAAGARRIEVASFVNPKRVPQMADADDLAARLPRVPGVRYVGLVLNRRGLERALAAGVDEIGMAVVASETFNQRNQSVSTDQSIDAWLEIAKVAQAAGMRAQVTIGAAFGCPFEGEVAPARVVAIAQRLAEAGTFEISLADTIGVAVPDQVRNLFELVRRAVPGIALRGHFHNTRNTAIANCQAALESGVTVLDAAVGGAGGCPFAPAATGNVATEDLLYLLHRSGHSTGISLQAMIDTARWLQPQLRRGASGALLRAGVFPAPAESASGREH